MSMTYKEARKLLEHYRHGGFSLPGHNSWSVRKLFEALDAFDGQIDMLEDEVGRLQDKDCSDEDWGI